MGLLRNAVSGSPVALQLNFYNVVFATDGGSGTVQVISPISNAIEFLEAVGGVYKAFSVHEKGAQYHKYDLKSALHLVERCRVGEFSSKTKKP